ncbi:MAG: nicotinamide riboside transporter PnuC [Bacteroidota bacterium]
MQEFLNGVVAGVKATGLLEWVAVFFGITSVIFSMLRRVLVYPTGIVSVVIYVYIAFEYKLYADAGVNLYYFIMSVYGWYFWANGKQENSQVVISANNRFENLQSLLILITSFVVISQILIRFTDSDVPYWDATTTSFAITGMWLMARKKVENWIAWIITDMISVPLYFYKGLFLTSFQFFVFTILAFVGFMTWQSTLRNQRKLAHYDI